MFQTNPENAAIIQKLEVALCQSSIGAVLSYDDLVRLAGINIRRAHRHLLVAAVEGAEKSLGACFETVRNVGVRRLPTDNIPDIGLAAVRRCRRAAKRGKKRLDRVNPNSLAPSAQRRKIGYSAMLGAIALVSDGRKAESIAAVADPDRTIPPGNILDMFRVTEPA